MILEILLLVTTLLAIYIVFIRKTEHTLKDLLVLVMPLILWVLWFIFETSLPVGVVASEELTSQFSTALLPKLFLLCWIATIIIYIIAIGKPYQHAEHAHEENPFK